jgi:hypothetical protein
MKKKLFFTLLQLMVVTVCCSQKLPNNIPKYVQDRFSKIKTNIKLALDSCRLNTDINLVYCSNLLSFELLDYPVDQQKEIELSKLNLNCKHSGKYMGIRFFRMYYFWRQCNYHVITMQSKCNINVP